jgi:glycerol-3-phosphate cytidylyltransferase
MGIKVFLIKFFYLIILMIVITFGTFDLFHIGHINILERAKKKGDKLIVGVSTDKLNFSKKQKYPIYSQNERKKIIDSLKFVDEVFFEESLEKKREYILKYKADILVMGNDWEGRFDEFNDICEVIYLERTPSISTTLLVEVIKNI